MKSSSRVHACAMSNLKPNCYKEVQVTEVKLSFSLSDSLPWLRLAAGNFLLSIVQFEANYLNCFESVERSLIVVGWMCF